MNGNYRSKLHQEIVEELLASKAINLEAVAATLGKFGERTVREGEAFVTIINRNVMWNCGWPGPELDIVREQLADVKARG